jgi:RHS repeat-associated protein
VIARQWYHPYGSVRAAQGALPTRRAYTGQLADETGLYFYNARYYSPLFGRFISADSIVPEPGNPQSLNRYSYVLNNPLKYTDPSGHAEKDPFKRFLCDWAPQLCQPSTPPLLNEQQAGQAPSAQQTPVMLNDGTQVPLFAAKREGEGEGKGGGIGGLIGSLLRLLGGGRRRQGRAGVI